MQWQCWHPLSLKTAVPWAFWLPEEAIAKDENVKANAATDSSNLIDQPRRHAYCYPQSRCYDYAQARSPK